MKKATAILLSSAILLSLLSGCGKSSEVSSTPSVSSSTTSDSSSPMESETNTSTATPASSDTQPVSLLFKKATGFSRELVNTGSTLSMVSIIRVIKFAA